MAGDTAGLDHCRVRGPAGPDGVQAGVHRRRAVLRRICTRGIPRDPSRSSTAAAKVPPRRTRPRSAWSARLLAGAILASGLEGLGFRLRRTLIVPGMGLLDGLLGAVLGMALGLGIVWILAAVAAQTPGQASLRADIQRSAILRGLNEVLPPSGADPERARAARPAAVDHGPLAGRRRAGAGGSPAPRRARAPRVASCACSGRRAAWRSRAPAGSSAPKSS